MAIQDACHFIHALKINRHDKLLPVAETSCEDARPLPSLAGERNRLIYCGLEPSFRTHFGAGVVLA